MFDLRTLDDLNQLDETFELECKLALGQNGQSEVPKYFWLTYADYSDRASVLVVKSPAGVSFRNPGMMRVPVEQALHGGASDCRNRTLHQMFLLINLGERAGSGVPKIRSGWAQAGHALELHDSFEPFDHTVLEMKWAPEARQTTESSEETSEETSQRILGLLRQSPAWSARQLASQLGLSQKAVELHLARLKAGHKLKRVGPNKGGRWEVLS